MTETSPLRHVHLGIGNFARAHTLVHTADAGTWRVAAFTGRSPAMAETLAAQDGRYGLIVRGAEGDDVRLIDVIDEVHPGSDTDTLDRLIADPATRVVTLTITEKGYAAGNDPATSTPARLAQALQARRGAQVTEPIALVSCDNLTGNGEVLREALLSAVDALAPDEEEAGALREWCAEHVDIVSSMVDRITPAAAERDREVVREAIGMDDAAPVVTEPFHEWVLEDRFRGERPAWERAGARFTDDVARHEKRKLRLLNGAHTLLAYAGQNAGHERVDQAIGDPELRTMVLSLWAEARRTLDLPEDELEQYTQALLERFENPRLADALRRIAADGSAKLPVRVLRVIAELGGPHAAPGETAAVAAWARRMIDQVEGGIEVLDPRAEQIAAAVGRGERSEQVRALVDLLESAQVGVDAADLADEVLALL